MVFAYAEVLLQHELAESHEAVPQWKALLARAGDRKIEHYLRAVKDLVADTSDTGPLLRIVQTRDRGALGLSIGLMDGYRRLLFPDIREAYTRFLRDGNWEIMDDARLRGYVRFIALRDRIIDLSSQSDQEVFNSRLRTMIREAEREASSASTPVIPPGSKK
jgi:hypothetical protein